jgi:hypothetical protein
VGGFKIFLHHKFDHVVVKWLAAKYIKIYVARADYKMCHNAAAD